MEICTKDRVVAMLSDGRLGLSGGENAEALFLDDVRIGLRLRDKLLEVRSARKPRSMDSARKRELYVAEATLRPGRLYLGLSREELWLPPNVMGLLYTRSKYARLGLNMMGSSVFVIPGFGGGTPTPIAFELSVLVRMRGLTASERYAFLVLYELSGSVSTGGDVYRRRFPLPSLE